MWDALTFIAGLAYCPLKKWRKERLIKTGLAQLVEHWSPKPGVGSSSLSTRANIKIIYLNR